MKLKKDTTYYNTDRYFSSGHYAVRKEFLRYVGLAKVASLLDGKYEGDIRVCSVDNSVTHTLEQYFLRDRSGYVCAKLTNEARIHPASHKITTIIMRDENDNSIGINPDYTELLSLGDPMIKGPNDPILVVQDGEIRAVVMPIKL